MEQVNSLTGEPILVASGISKRYGGVAALKHVGLELRQGEILGLCGENGAGKSSFIKILGGIVEPDEGSLHIGGKSVTFGRRPDSSLLSIVHQELSVVPHLSVLENVMMNRKSAGWGPYFRARYASEARDLLDLVGLSHVDPLVRAHSLTLAEQQLVEIARGLASKSRVLLLDEPTATLSDAEITQVFAVLRAVKQRGTSIVIVSHRLGEIFALTDRIAVFRNGEHLFTKPTSEMDIEELVRAMIGRDLKHEAHSARDNLKRSGALRLSASNLAVEGSFGPVNVDVAPGEIVALVGQLGSGADWLLETMAGLRRPTGGGLCMDGKSIKLGGIADAYRQDIAYVAEDRAGRGVFLNASIEVNVTSQILDRVCVGGLISRKASKERALVLARAFQIDTRRISHRVSSLSGGNQQKVSLAKAAASEPKLLLLNEPTRGVDIGARSEIYTRLRDMARDGLAVVFYSTDLEEVLEIADHVVTIYRGGVVRDLERSDADADGILNDILHGREGTLQ